MTAKVCQHTVGLVGGDGESESAAEVEREAVRFCGAFAVPVEEETWPKWADADELASAGAEAELVTRRSTPAYGSCPSPS